VLALAGDLGEQAGVGRDELPPSVRAVAGVGVVGDHALDCENFVYILMYNKNKNNWKLEIAFSVNALSFFAFLYILLLSVKSAQWHGAENYGRLATLVVGLTTLFVQTIIFIPLTFACNKDTNCLVKSWGNKITSILSILIPALTFLTILIEEFMTN